MATYILNIAPFLMLAAKFEKAMSQTTPGSSNRPTLPDLYNDLQVGVIIHSTRTGAILDVNERLESMYGYPKRQLRNMSVEEFSANTYSFTQEEADRRIQAAANGQHQTFEWRVKRADGRLIWVDVDLYRTNIDGAPVVMGEVRNITKYKNTDRRVGLFHRILRHNLRNEVNVIAGNASRIEANDESSESKQAAQAIKTKATELIALAEAVKEIESSLSTTKSDTNRRRVYQAVNDDVEQIEKEYPRASIATEEQTEMWADLDDNFSYALYQAVENAIIHNERPAPAVKIIVDDSPNTGRVRIRIDDENPQLPDSELAAIDYHDETTSIKHGSGIGLFVMKWCIEAIGGELKIDSGTSGNRVTFLLPETPQQDT